MPGRFSARSRCSRCAGRDDDDDVDVLLPPGFEEQRNVEHRNISPGCCGIGQKLRPASPAPADARQPRSSAEAQARACTSAASCCRSTLPSTMADGRNGSRWQPPHRHPWHRAHAPRHRCRRPECRAQQTSSPSRSCPWRSSLSARQRSWTIIRIDVAGDQRVKLRRHRRALRRTTAKSRAPPGEAACRGLRRRYCRAAPHPREAWCGAAYRRYRSRRPTVQAAKIEFECRLALHAERGRVDQKAALGELIRHALPFHRHDA